MPFVSQATIDRCNNVLATGTADAIRTMLRTHPILPPSGGIHWKAINPNAASFAEVVKLDYTKLKFCAAADSIMFIKLRANEKNEIGAMTFTMKMPSELPSVVSRNGWVPVWWLPWQSKHVVKIKIRSNATTPNIAMPHPIVDIPNPKSVFYRRHQRLFGVRRGRYKIAEHVPRRSRWQLRCSAKQRNHRVCLATTYRPGGQREDDPVYREKRLHHGIGSEWSDRRQSAYGERLQDHSVGLGFREPTQQSWNLEQRDGQSMGHGIRCTR